MSPLESIVEDLKALPPARLEVAADFVHRLKRISEEERQAILIRTAGALSAEEAGELERVIEEGCEKVDEDGW
ncbi:MAG: hypothetical protein HYR60_28960 [Acidobacteria bacterium]|nr:hypothetical protein [Acidobacteriota bacterium]MBI3470403.1 hypothetical protein [Candidatus Solibacter usitatus]